MTMQKIARSYLRGESHPQARASDRDVAMAVELVTVHGLTSREVAEKFDVAPRTVRDWVNRTYRGAAR